MAKTSAGPPATSADEAFLGTASKTAEFFKHNDMPPKVFGDEFKPSLRQAAPNDSYPLMLW